MPALIVILAVCVGLAGAVFAASTQNNVFKNTNKSNHSVIQASPSASISSSAKPASSPKNDQSVNQKNNSSQHTSIVINQQTENNSNTSNESGEVNLNSFKYPGAVVVNQSKTTISLSSSDSPDSLTSWYKQKLLALKMGAQSFVTTSTNGIILNKLAVAGNGAQIKITISKNKAEDAKVLVMIDTD